MDKEQVISTQMEGVDICDPIPNRIVLGFKFSQPRIWIEPLSYALDEPYKWYIRMGGGTPVSYMDKETGVFGYTDDYMDIHRHLFNTWEDAAKCFEKFHKQ